MPTSRTRQILTRGAIHHPNLCLPACIETACCPNVFRHLLSSSGVRPASPTAGSTSTLPVRMASNATAVADASHQ
eukprot:6194669-Pleurochrysis_carterae.AAC.4